MEFISCHCGILYKSYWELIKLIVISRASKRCFDFHQATRSTRKPNVQSRTFKFPYIWLRPCMELLRLNFTSMHCNFSHYYALAINPSLSFTILKILTVLLFHYIYIPLYILFIYFASINICFYLKTILDVWKIDFIWINAWRNPFYLETAL